MSMKDRIDCLGKELKLRLSTSEPLSNFHKQQLVSSNYNVDMVDTPNGKHSNDKFPNQKTVEKSNFKFPKKKKKNGDKMKFNNLEDVKSNLKPQRILNKKECELMKKRGIPNLEIWPQWRHIQAVQMHKNEKCFCGYKSKDNIFIHLWKHELCFFIFFCQITIIFLVFLIF